MEKKWWHDRIAYQIYPKSFQDSNGDGIGDLNGITSRLDYLKELGIDMIWISPVYVSPFVDQGYDIADYYAVDPLFGTMGDMENLLAEAKKRDIRIVMDLVVNHCSDQHEWFQKALKDPYGEYGQYFYFKEGVDGHAPCNWRSYFGGSVWTKVDGYDNLYYLHMFAPQQPDLNWENPELRKKIYEMIRWWLEKGVSGFRIDAIINIKKDLTFSDYPADRDDGLCEPAVMLKNAVGIQNFLLEMKEQAFDPYDAFTIGELFNYKPKELEFYIGDHGCFSSIFDFSTEEGSQPKSGAWYDYSPISQEQYKKLLFSSKAMSQDIGLMANVIENHDQPRGVSRYIPKDEKSEKAKKLLAGITFSMIGMPFLFQGQEIGMENTRFQSIDEINDVSTIDQYKNALKNGYDEREALNIVCTLSRDNARTPMQWNCEKGAGFTTGTPWLRFSDSVGKLCVEEQMKQKDSVWNFYKKLIALRKDEQYKDIFIYGKQEPYHEEIENLVAYYRKYNSGMILVMGNFQKEERVVELPDGIQKILLSNLENASDLANHFKRNDRAQINLEGYQFVIFEVEK